MAFRDRYAADGLPAADVRAAERPGRGDWLLCAACDARIATLAAAVSVAGCHLHTCTNPAGYVYVIRCFATAPGCKITGSLSEEFTWFPGHAWQIASCRECGEHLGWRFRARDGGGFFGLIRERLRSAS
ncbi:MAG: hypothetical protein IT495_02645 [Gammaproteobacteria bacterium]|nr:hypothetical protein [Gammaproteobacteria bacterium]